MNSFELTSENIKNSNHQDKNRNQYPTPLPASTSSMVLGNSKEEDKDKPTMISNPNPNSSLRSLDTLQRMSSTMSDSGDSVISKTSRNQDGSPTNSTKKKKPKRRRMSTIDVLYQMQTQQLEENVPTATCTDKSIHPHSEFRTRWDIGIAFCLAYNAIAIPYRICFDVIATTDEGIFWFDRCVDLVFIIDVIINFYTGYVRTKDNQVELTPSKVKWNYFKTWFLVDFLSSIPYELIILAAVSNDNGEGDSRATESAQLLKSAKTLKVARYIRFVKLVKFLRFARAVHIIKRFEKVS